MNAFVSTVTQKGQVTIPKRVRDDLHLVTGDKVEFVMNERGEVVIQPINRKVVEVAGILSQYKKSHSVSVEEMDQAVAELIRDKTQ